MVPAFSLDASLLYSEDQPQHARSAGGISILKRKRLIRIVFNRWRDL